ncbi:MAG TPA: ABC transporter permease [Bacteroidota bacterium]|nr:ABC transporter permease [Bacteroidota bacterium]
MSGFAAALWAETLKLRRSKILWLTAAGFCILPLVAGLFMIILKDPVAARDMGLISTKAQLSGASADWPGFFGIVTQGIAVAAMILFAINSAWIFGREFADHTIKELMALPTSRGAIVLAKFLLLTAWSLLLALFVFGVGIAVGSMVGIPAWSMELVWDSFLRCILIAALHVCLLPAVALVASMARGYLAPLGWTFLTLALAQIVAALGWGEVFPWSVPVMFSGMAGAHAGTPGWTGVLLVLLTGAAAMLLTMRWWDRN